MMYLWLDNLAISRTRQQDRDRFSLGDLDDDVMRHMEACLEHGTPQTAVWIDREAEFSDYGQDNMTINILRPEVYSFVGTEILGMRPSELCDAGFGALLERMRVSETCMIDSFHCWGNLRASRDEYALWQDGSPWLRIRYINRSSSWLAGGLASARDDSWEMGLCERLLDGWILYLLVRWLGIFRRFMVLVSYRTILHRALQFAS
jgi:hypothetical protein